MTRQLLRSAAILFISICTTVASAAPTITKLGATPDGGQPFVIGLSGDGTTVVGSTYDLSTGISGEIRWTAATGTQDIGPGFAAGTSADGSVVVGTDANNAGFRWTAATGAVGIGFLPGGTYSFVNGVNANGSVVVGFANDGITAYNSRWTAATGIPALPTPSGYGYSAGADRRSRRWFGHRWIQCQQGWTCQYRPRLPLHRCGRLPRPRRTARVHPIGGQGCKRRWEYGRWLFSIVPAAVRIRSRTWRLSLDPIDWTRPVVLRR